MEIATTPLMDNMLRHLGPRPGDRTPCMSVEQMSLTIGLDSRKQRAVIKQQLEYLRSKGLVDLTRANRWMLTKTGQARVAAQ